MSDRKLVVLGIPWDVETDGLKEYMSKFGEMEDCIVMKEKFNELLNEEPEDVRSEESVKNKIFDQVMGPEKSGRVRTYGLGPTPSLVFGLSSGYTRVNHISMEETIRAFFFIVVRPFSKSLYRKINKVVAELLWLEVIWLFDWWANIKVELFTDSETLELVGKEHALLIPNHKSDIDRLVGWVLAQRSGCLGSSLALIKKSSKFLLVIGWSMWFSEYIFLERSWVKDETTLKKGLKNLNDFPHPFWLALFVEGTRFTQAKLVAAQEYATSMSLPVPRNVLIPRTKGFVSAVNYLRTFVPAIYNVSVAIPKTKPLPTMLRLLRGSSSTINQDKVKNKQQSNELRQDKTKKKHHITDEHSKKVMDHVSSNTFAMEEDHYLITLLFEQLNI